MIKSFKGSHNILVKYTSPVLDINIHFGYYFIYLLYLHHLYHLDFTIPMHISFMP